MFVLKWNSAIKKKNVSLGVQQHGGYLNGTFAVSFNISQNHICTVPYSSLKGTYLYLNVSY